MGVNGTTGLDTRIGAPRGPKPGRKPGVLVGQKRAKKLRRMAAEMEAARGHVVPATTRPRQYFQGILDDVTIPTEMRMAAAKILLQFERPEDDPPNPPSKIDWGMFTQAQRNQIREALTLLAQVSSTQRPPAAERVIDGELADTQPARDVQKRRVTTSSNSATPANRERTT